MIGVLLSSTNDERDSLEPFLPGVLEQARASVTALGRIDVPASGAEAAAALVPHLVGCGDGKLVRTAAGVSGASGSSGAFEHLVSKRVQSLVGGGVAQPHSGLPLFLVGKCLDTRVDTETFGPITVAEAVVATEAAAYAATAAEVARIESTPRQHLVGIENKGTAVRKAKQLNAAAKDRHTAAVTALTALRQRARRGGKPFRSWAWPERWLLGPWHGLARSCGGILERLFVTAHAIGGDALANMFNVHIYQCLHLYVSAKVANKKGGLVEVTARGGVGIQLITTVDPSWLISCVRVETDAAGERVEVPGPHAGKLFPPGPAKILIQLLTDFRDVAKPLIQLVPSADYPAVRLDYTPTVSWPLSIVNCMCLAHVCCLCHARARSCLPLPTPSTCRPSFFSHSLN